MLRSFLLRTLLIGLGIHLPVLAMPHLLESHIFDPGYALSNRADMNVDAVLEKISETENRALPKMVNDSMRLDKVAALPGKRFMRQYTVMSGAEQDEIRFRHTTLPTLKNEMCADKSLAMFFKHGISVTQAYKSLDGQDMGTVHMSPTECTHPA